MMAKPGKECRDSLQNWKHKMQLCIDGERPVDNPENTTKSVNHEVTEAKRLSVLITGMFSQLNKVLTHTEADSEKRFPCLFKGVPHQKAEYRYRITAEYRFVKKRNAAAEGNAPPPKEILAVFEGNTPSKSGLLVL